MVVILKEWSLWISLSLSLILMLMMRTDHKLWLKKAERVPLVTIEKCWGNLLHVKAERVPLVTIGKCWGNLIHVPCQRSCEWGNYDGCCFHDWIHLQFLQGPWLESNYKHKWQAIIRLQFHFGSNLEFCKV